MNGERKENISIYSETIAPKVEFEFKMKIFLTEVLKKKLSSLCYHEIVKSAILSGDPVELLPLWKEGERISVETERGKLILTKNKSDAVNKLMKILYKEEGKKSIIRLGKHEA